MPGKKIPWSERTTDYQLGGLVREGRAETLVAHFSPKRAGAARE